MEGATVRGILQGVQKQLDQANANLAAEEVRQGQGKRQRQRKGKGHEDGQAKRE